MLSRIIMPILCMLTTAIAVVAARSSEPNAPAAQAQTAAAAPRAQADPRWLGDDLPLLPAGVTQAVRPVSMMRVTYEFAARHPEVMHYVPCFCGCERGGHKDNHDCFVTSRNSAGRVTGWETHALSCEVCVEVAYQAWQMHNTGASISAIRDAIEKKYASRTAEGLHTPTPLPKRGGMSHD